MMSVFWRQNIHPLIEVNTAHVSAVGTSLSVLMAPFTSDWREVTARQPDRVSVLCLRGEASANL